MLMMGVGSVGRVGARTGMIVFAGDFGTTLMGVTWFGKSGISSNFVRLKVVEGGGFDVGGEFLGSMTVLGFTVGLKWAFIASGAGLAFGGVLGESSVSKGGVCLSGRMDWEASCSNLSNASNGISSPRSKIFSAMVGLAMYEGGAAVCFGGDGFGGKITLSVSILVTECVTFAVIGSSSGSESKKLDRSPNLGAGTPEASSKRT